MEELKLLLSAVRRAVLGEDVPFDTTPEILARVCALAKAHDLSLIALEGLSHVELPPQVHERLLRHGAAAVGRFYSQNAAVERLTAALEEAAVGYMPLKGMVIRALYLNPEWRVGRDVDILVRRTDFDRARAIAAEVLAPAKISEGSHDVGFETAEGVRVELHFSLFNGDEGFGDLLSDPFANAIAGEGHCYRLPDAELYAYHIAHMAKHFRHGGCGLRAFLDLFLLECRLSADDADQARILLREAGLTGFEAVVRRQARVFFKDEAGDADTDRLAAFVARNQAFGSFRSEAAADAGQGKGKRGLGGVLARAFPPYRKMCYLFPVLRRWPILLPFCWIVRGLRVFSKKDRARFFAASRATARVSGADVAEMTELYQYLKLEG